MDNQEHLDRMLKDVVRKLSLIESGYAGIMPDGRIVDRREYPSAVPAQRNTALGTLEPKPPPPEGENR
jgi:hypothetical protein